MALLMLAGSLARAQDLLPAPKLVTPSLVFPDGGFPAEPVTPAGDLPAGPAQPSPLLADNPDYLEADDVQNAPGRQYFLPPAAPLPDYFYQPAYYETPVTSPRSIIEYAPPGYEARDQQYGPGTPEFTPITPPPRISPADQERFVTRGIMPGSFLVPGTNTSFRFRGFVRLMGLYDFDPIGSADSFVPNTIPVPQTEGQNFNMGARYSRIATETWTPTSFYGWTVHTFIEGDFFNGPAQAVGGGGNPFRLRHAFIDFGYFRVGQQNTVFMDASSWPNVVDFQGPAGWANARRPGARATVPLSDLWFWAIGVEQPFADITTNGLGSNVQDVPDFASHLRYEGDVGHVQVSGLLRAIGYRPTEGSVTRRTGCGFSASTTFHPWAYLIGSNSTHKANPTGLERCRLIGQYTCGWGIGRYLQDTAGLGLDGQVDPATSGFDLPYLAGWVLSYEHWYNEKWLTAITWSQVLAASNAGQAGTTYTGSKYFTTNLWYIPFRNMSLGIEYIHGERENLDMQRGRANRVNALAQYNF